MLSRMLRLAAVLTVCAGCALAAVACDEDEVQQAIDEFLATDTPEGAETPAPEATDEPTDEPTGEATTGTELTSTEGGCEHGQGESTLFIVVRDVPAGETITGTIVESPEGGLVDPAEFTGTADEDGRVVVRVKIRRFGTYRWNAGGDSGEYIGEYVVAAECPGEPQ
jgi:hypothetical protein